MITVLLVEDNEMNRDMLSRRLERKGYSVIVAEDGREGVELAVQALPDLILMDMSLPVLDGWAATSMLKGSASTQHIPIIALTAHAMSTDEQRCYQAGCDEFDTKPVVLERLLAKMDKCLRK